MSPWHCAFVLLLVAAISSGCAGARTDETPPDDTPQFLERVRKKYKFPALAVVVVKDGKVCERGAVGVRKQGAPELVTTNDQFHIGSCTKSFTATVAAMLIEEGKLGWEMTITNVFPELSDTMDEHYRSVTVEQLLTHRGGMPGDPPKAAWARAWEERGTPTQQRYEFIQAVLSQPPAAPPGSKYLYSNQGYAIVGAMMEKVTGTSYEALMTNRLFKPLRMDSAGFGPPGTLGKVEQPWGHRSVLSFLTPNQVDNPPAISPAGRIHCSLDDLAAYACLHLQGEGLDGLLKSETVRKLHTPTQGGDYACGWVSLERDWARGRALWHNGSNGSWYAVLWLAPAKNFAVITLTNTGADNPNAGCDEVATAMVKKWLP
jgi:CubicO group peptidase (beta-lactamase class C family)